MVITPAGFRLYFTLFKSGFRNTIGLTSSIPNALELGHVRFPPPTDASNPLNIRNSYYDCGICLSINTLSQTRDSIAMTATAPSIIPEPQQPSYSVISAVPNRPVYVETFSSVNVPTMTWLLAECKPEKRGKHPIKEIAQQLSQPPREFMALSTQCIYFYNKLRPVDVLFKILGVTGRLPVEEQKDYQAFFDRYGKTESCAMCLSVICNSETPNIVAKATAVFFEFGGAPTAFNSVQAPTNHLGQVMGLSGVKFSGRHDGFLLYLSRMLAPIWKLKVFAHR